MRILSWLFLLYSCLCIASSGTNPYGSESRGNKKVTEGANSQKLSGCWYQIAQLTSATEGFFDLKKAHIKGKTKTRFVMLIGVPGSGKSYFSMNAVQKGWAVISSDAIRVEVLGHMQKNNQVIMFKGREEIADPCNPNHHLAVTGTAMGIVKERIRYFLNKSIPIVLDAMNLTGKRADFLKMAYQSGYHTEAVIFEPQTSEVANSNINRRVKEGGIDLGLLPDTCKDESRVKVVSELIRQMGETALPVSDKPLPSHSVSNELQRYHFVNKLHRIQVRDYSKPS